MNDIKILVTNEGKIPRNYFVIDRDENENASLLPPPRHFKYEMEDRAGLCYYKIVEDKTIRLFQRPYCVCVKCR